MTEATEKDQSLETIEKLWERDCHEKVFMIEDYSKVGIQLKWNSSAFDNIGVAAGIATGIIEWEMSKSHHHQ